MLLCVSCFIGEIKYFCNLSIEYMVNPGINASETGKF